MTNWPPLWPQVQPLLKTLNWSLARSFLSGVTTEEKQKCLFLCPGPVHEKKIWS